MKVKASAKVNLMLDILKRLDNGYHSLFMIMQSVDLFDVVNVEKNQLNKVVIKCDNDKVPCNEKNIVYK
jgi:4-diphosphocytidyl-2-C-methyl-D-erythritol kinase